MPAGAPFTQLCQQLSRRQICRADLHVHTTCSDGVYTPLQVVELARRSGLAALAITDHDTLAAIGPAAEAAGEALELIAGVEISCHFQDKELHLLGYLFDPGNASLRTALDELAVARHDRFLQMLDRLGSVGIHLAQEDWGGNAVLGRRHLAEALVRAGRAGSVREAFQRYLGDRGQIAVPKRALPVAEALALIRQAGGVAAWAHPPYDDARAKLGLLRDKGLAAVEVEFPACRPAHGRALRLMAKELGLAVTGGSDCHGPEPVGRSIGRYGVSSAELAALKLLTI